MSEIADSLPPLSLDCSVTARFRQVVEKLADQPALRDGDDCLTYGELDAWSEHIAALISERVSEAARPVALHFAHGPAVIAAIFGALKAGVPYAVLDPAMPEERIQDILVHLQPDCVLTDLDAASVMQGFGSASIIPAEQMLVRPTAFAASQPRRLPPPPDALAAIYHTSGTTNQPKGVVWDHAFITRSAWQQTQIYRIQPGDVVSLLFSTAYASSVADLYGALLHGGTLAIYRLAHQGVAGLRDWLAAERVTVLHLHASVLHQLLDALPSSEHCCDALRFVRSSGRTPVADVQRMLAHLQPEAIFAHWLSSSETLQITCFVARPGDRLIGEITPVGAPVDTAEIRLLGAGGETISGEGSGEIFVRSRYLARGYWNQPELTAQRFQTDPADPRYRIYRMGDLARRRPDGMLELLGRNDRRVKVRGYTVDLEAVEAALSRLPGVREAVVVARTTRHDAILCAYFALEGPGADNSVTVLRTALAQELPAYMLPARIVILDALPRQPNGKVDASALLPPGNARPAIAAPFVAPRNELEQQIADLWAELLELDEVGVDDNFFELGGDSILAMRMIAHLEAQTGRRVSAAYFGNPTVSALARLAISGDNAAPASPASADSADSLAAAHAVARPAPRRTGPGYQMARRLAVQGPVLYGRGLPYALGVRLQRFWIRTPGYQSLLMQKHIAQLAVWRDSVDSAAAWRQVVEINLAANTWTAWRMHALSTPSMQSRWIVTQGDAAAIHSLENGRQILVDNHSAVQWARRKVYAAYGTNAVRVGYHGPTRKAELHADFARQMLAARATLEQDGPVLLAGDGFGGWQGVDVPFFGHVRRFRAGAAELAVQTGAALTPVFTTLRADGVIVNEVLAPLVSESGSHAAQVESLTRKYAALYVARWPALLASLQWGQLRTLNREVGLVQA